LSRVCKACLPTA